MSDGYEVSLDEIEELLGDNDDESSDSVEGNAGGSNEPINRSIYLEASSFDKLMEIIAALSKQCTDVTIKESCIRQVTDNKKCVYEVDLSDIIGDNIEILFPNSASKVDLFEPYKKQKVDVTIQITENNGNTYYHFSDTSSKITLPRAIEQYMGNQYHAPDELRNKLKKDEDNIYFTMSLGKNFIDRIVTFSRVANCQDICIKFNGDTADIKTATQSRSDGSASTSGSSGIIAKITTINLDQTLEGMVYVSIDPFLFGFDEIEGRCYGATDSDDETNFLIIELESKIKGIAVKSYSKAILQ